MSLGGALGLAHYYEYRPTHDVDAWWTPEATEEDRRQVIEVVRAALQPFGQTRVRSWGDVVSVELAQEGRVGFSFRIARRLAQLAPSQPAPWADILLDSLDDLVAGKMVALVEWGLLRDQSDVYALCQAAVVSPARCWTLWRERQRLAGSDADAVRARLAVQTHLARVATQRPLERIADPQERAGAERTRAWLTKEFLDALMD